MSIPQNNIWPVSSYQLLSAQVFNMGWSWTIVFLLSVTTGKELASFKPEEGTGTEVTVTYTMPFSSQESTLRYNCSSLVLSLENLGPQWSCPARLLATPSLTTLFTGWSRSQERAWSGLDIFILKTVILSTIRSSRARPHWLQTHPPAQPTWSSAAWHLKTLQSITVQDTVLQPHPECVRNPEGQEAALRIRLQRKLSMLQNDHSRCPLTTS